MRVFIDSNIFVYAAQSNPKFGPSCKKIIKDIESRKIEAITSVINITESVEVIERNADRKTALAVLELLLALPMDVEDVVKEHSINALYIFSTSKANYSDAVIASIMKEKFIDTIITNDADFESIKGINVIKPLNY